jgi:RNA-directed DNA polymerase
VIVDRVRQAQVVSALEPEWEARFEPKSYGFRPGRGCHDAIACIFTTVRGHAAHRGWVLDADLAAAFDRIDHSHLLASLDRFPARGLIERWLKAGVVEHGRLAPTEEGTPQGGVISPLLANLYLDGLDKAVNGGRQMKAVMVRFADDFVILCRKGQGAEMKRRLESWVERRKLRLNEKKTHIVDFDHESFEFLGFRLAWRKARSGKSYPHCEPSAKSCNKLREAIREQTGRDTLWKSPKEVFAAVNRRLRGWIGYFHYANSTRVFGKMQWSTRERLRRWLWKKHAKTQARYGSTYSDESLHDHYGLMRFPMRTKWQTL